MKEITKKKGTLSKAADSRNVEASGWGPDAIHSGNAPSASPKVLQELIAVCDDAALFYIITLAERTQTRPVGSQPGNSRLCCSNNCCPNGNLLTAPMEAAPACWTNTTTTAKEL